MNVYEGMDSLPAPFAATSVAIGTFDGVHRGHQAIIARAVEDARKYQRPAVVFTFDRHPLELLRPELAPSLLTTPGQRNALIAEIGAASLVIARFDFALSELSPDEFMSRILKGALGAQAIVEGTNFGFGKGRAGDLNYLQRAQGEYDFALHALEPVLVDGEPASSTRIREQLREGNISEAENILGHPFLLEGRIVTGQRLGRTLGYPTANLSPSYRQTIPGDGIYAVIATLHDGRKIGGACSIGNRPTVGGAGHSIETFLIDFQENLYGREMALRFVKRLRLEEKFNSLEDLKVQMALDVEQARTVLLSFEKK